MAKFNMDEQDQLAGPIELQLGDKVFSIQKLTGELIEKSDNAGKEKTLDAVYLQLSALTGAPVDELKKYDVRTTMKALRFITQEIEAGVSSKN
ncbi:MAG TPA: hypothetical protein PLB05_06015 [Candidatus Omnitrophota bacterium]|nr:hypothetical protein [Candidatus Omnitrophota bacterium]